MPHIHEKIDFTVDAFIVYNQKVLLLFHKKHQMWLAPGGHVELHEDPEEAMIREAKEECGLDIELLGEKPNIIAPNTKFLHTPAFLDIHKVSETHQHISLRYFAKAKSDKIIQNEKESDDIRWFSKEDLENPEFNLHPTIKFYAIEALKRINS